MMLTMDQACPDDLPSMMSTMQSLATQVSNEKVLNALNVLEIRFKSLRNTLVLDPIFCLRDECCAISSNEEIEVKQFDPSEKFFPLCYSYTAQ
ncbi:Oidioi.mRNA.OKI2018_I69.chr1.g1538.t1.cds [Oikopleura dioica]|uniref:Oidioi.mRNA.OKI2018_I69.chr1.g1538.t1.cds n=1 Tax=Oikopleura dioica TaxID=34765 RepID=A0ABN7SV78_OIKDI|nr:Oidioi.mRNA.OKI2018_I69.chr1.g1538.t1.cds [Oikopleura dioica]